jgi:hypothetical protein
LNAKRLQQAAAFHLNLEIFKEDYFGEEERGNIASKDNKQTFLLV